MNKDEETIKISKACQLGLRNYMQSQTFIMVNNINTPLVNKKEESSDITNYINFPDAISKLQTDQSTVISFDANFQVWVNDENNGTGTLDICTKNAQGTLSKEGEAYTFKIKSISFREIGK